jgi:KDO2-lipid IV(A) lauroyltransferase
MPYLTDLRYRSEYMALRLLVALMHALPLEVSVNVSGKVLRLMARFDRRHKRALQNLEIAFPPQERQMPSFFVSVRVAAVPYARRRVIKMPRKFHLSLDGLCIP